MTPRELARRAVDAGVETVIVLDLARVGGAGGVDEAMMRELRAALPGVDLIAGGGVRDRADLDRLAAAGANGALVATAVHRGAIGRERERARASGACCPRAAAGGTCPACRAFAFDVDVGVRASFIGIDSCPSLRRVASALSQDVTRACRCTREASAMSR